MKAQGRFTAAVTAACKKDLVRSYDTNLVDKYRKQMMEELKKKDLSEYDKYREKQAYLYAYDNF